MKLKKDFIIHETGGESLLVPVGQSDFSGIVKGNKTLGVILSLLKEDTTEEAVVAAITARFSAKEEIVARDVHRAVTELRRIGALEE